MQTSSSSRFLVYSQKVWKGVIGDTEIPISQIASVDAGTFKARRLTLNLTGSKERSALINAVKKNYGFEVTVGGIIYIFKINHVRDGDYFVVPEDPDREPEFAYDMNVLSSGCLFFKLSGGAMVPQLYVIDHIPAIANASTASPEASPQSPSNFTFDKEQFRGIRADTKHSLQHYKLALKFEVCVFSQFAILAKKEVDANVPLAQIASTHVNELIHIHKNASMDEAAKLNLTILYLSMARAFSDKIGTSFADTANSIADAIDKIDITATSTRPIDPKAKNCLASLITESSRIMGTKTGRFDSEKAAATKAYKDIVDSPASVLTTFMKNHPQVARLLIAHLITSAYSIFLANVSHKNTKNFTEKIVLKF